MRHAIELMCLGWLWACAAPLDVAEQRAALRLDASIAISQVYGGAGNSHAPYQHDFVELVNRSNADVECGTSAAPLAVHSVQGASHRSPYDGQCVNVGPAVVTVVRDNQR